MVQVVKGLSHLHLTILRKPINLKGHAGISCYTPTLLESKDRFPDEKRFTNLQGIIVHPCKYPYIELSRILLNLLNSYPSLLSQVFG